MFTLSLSSLPTILAVLAFLLALYYKRETICNSDLLAFALVAAVVFLLLTGALNALHLPNFALHLF